MSGKTRAVATFGGLALAVGLLAIPTGAQETKGRAKAAPPGRASEPGRAGEPARVAHPEGVHVPDHFNQLEPPLTPEQRERIYEIQTRALRESEAVLTAAQRSSLQSHRSRGGATPRGERSPLPGSETPRNSGARKKAG